MEPNEIVIDPRFAAARERQANLIRRVSESQDGNPITKFFDENNDASELRLDVIHGDDDPHVGDLLNYMLVRLLDCHSADGLARHLRYIRKQIDQALAAIPE